MKKILFFIITLSSLLVGCGKRNANVVTVTFDSNHGYFVTRDTKKYYVSVTKGTSFYEIVDNVPEPVSDLDTYTFSHWSKNGQRITEDFVIESNVIIKAEYEYIEPITITFDFNGGKYEGQSQINIKNQKGWEWQYLTKPVEDGIVPPEVTYEFRGWSRSKDEYRAISLEEVFNENAILYAHYRPMYLRFEAAENDSFVSFAHTAGIDADILYAKDKDATQWQKWNGSAIHLNSGESFYVKNTKNRLSIDKKRFFIFKMSGAIKASGNINSMVNFSNITAGDFYSLFKNCGALITAPDLPSTTLASGCYAQMFMGCTSLVTAPELPALLLPTHAYQSMFAGCVSLRFAPVDLPALGLSFESYRTMFAGCISLERAPIIYSLTSGNNSFVGMFEKCVSLSYIKTYYTGGFNKNFTNWVNGVNSTGVFYYTGNSITRGPTSIPESWLITPRYQLKLFLSHCRCSPKTIDFSNRETVDIKIIPDDGYKLPDTIRTNATTYVYNKEYSAFTFLGELSTITLSVVAVKL